MRWPAPRLRSCLVLFPSKVFLAVSEGKRKRGEMKQDPREREREREGGNESEMDAGGCSDEMI